MNKENLERAKEYIKTVPAEMFNMVHYRRDGMFTTQHCGSVGCAIGHSTALDSEENIDSFRDKGGDINFEKWSREFFDINFEEWTFVFSSFWSLGDMGERSNVEQKEQFIKRVDILIKNGNVPYDWDFKVVKNGNLPDDWDFKVIY